MFRNLAMISALLSACGGGAKFDKTSQPPEPMKNSVTLEPGETQELAVTSGTVGNSSLNTAISRMATPTRSIPNLQPFPNSRGYAATYSTAGGVDLDNLFFKTLGSNGRTCVSCHSPSTGWTVNPSDIRSRFNATNGIDPIFRPNDGAVCAKANVSTVQARSAAYGLLLRKGLFRIDLPMPTDREFDMVNATGVYCNTPMQSQFLPLFRRPLPSTNLKFLAAVMWDGRESKPGLTVREALLNQANNATVGHAQATSQVSPSDREKIVDFELGLFTAQISSLASLNNGGANGGPRFLADVPFTLGVNFPPNFNPSIFKLFEAWRTRPGSAGQAAIARGEQIFNNKKFRIRNVGGLPSSDFEGTCGTCHNTPNVGSFSSPGFVNIGIGAAIRRTPDMPLFTFRNKASGATVAVSDPGRALVTGKWDDIGKFKTPSLRALATRAPYFHDGSAATVEDVISFYVNRFTINMTPQEGADLSAFLRSL